MYTCRTKIGCRQACKCSQCSISFRFRLPCAGRKTCMHLDRHACKYAGMDKCTGIHACVCGHEDTEHATNTPACARRRPGAGNDESQPFQLLSNAVVLPEASSGVTDCGPPKRIHPSTEVISFGGQNCFFNFTPCAHPCPRAHTHAHLYAGARTLAYACARAHAQLQ